MKITDPYSPSARANARVNPVSRAGRIDGTSTRRNVCHRPAPRLAAASSTSGSRSSSTGCTARTTNGRPMNVSATTTPRRVNATCTPTSARWRPSHPFGEYTAVSAMPATDVGSANGRSTQASTSRRPEKPVAHQHPGHEQPEHRVDQRRHGGRPEAQTRGGQRPLAQDRRAELLQRQAPGAPHQARQRQQHQQAHVGQREPEGQAEPGQDVAAAGGGALHA